MISICPKRRAKKDGETFPIIAIPCLYFSPTKIRLYLFAKYINAIMDEKWHFPLANGINLRTLQEYNHFIEAQVRTEGQEKKYAVKQIEIVIIPPMEDMDNVSY